MSRPHSTPATPSDKPAKPSPDFPLFPHATKRWAKKIKGKMRYFGRWDDPDGALREYRALLRGTAPGQRRQPADKPGRPSKPTPDYPLFPHAGGVWAKKIRGKLYYFGPWSDPKGALDRYNAKKDDLHAGRKSRPDTEGATIKDVVNAFLNHKDALLDAGELSPHTWAKYKTATDLVITHFGKGRLAADLDAADFAALRKRMAKQWGVYRLADMIQHIRSIFKHGHDVGLLPLPVVFGPGFARPSKKAQRLHRAEQGPKLFTAKDVRAIIEAATVPMRAMILLGINCGMGNADCANLPLSAVDLETGWIDYPRPKTGIQRRCPLWPETIAALRDVLAKQPAPKSEEDAALVFVTKYGYGWTRAEVVIKNGKNKAKGAEGGPVTKEMRKLVNRLGFNGHRNFYTLRHTFRTVADESKDQPAVDFIMGHEVPHLSAVYRETISDERLRAVSEHVRKWLFPSTAYLKTAHEESEVCEESPSRA
jgi:integrase